MLINPGLWEARAAISDVTPDWLTLISGATSSDDKGSYSPADWIGLWTQDSQSAASSTVSEAQVSGTARTTLKTLDPAGQTVFWDVALSRMPGHRNVLAAARDVTAQVQREAQLRRIAYEDGLTGLLNRAALRERLDHTIADAAACGGTVGVLMLDLDNFKTINDTLGHDAGDAVLVEAASRLRACAPAHATVGRLGGDEFAIIVPASQMDVADIAEALLDEMRRPIDFKGRVLDTRASIGLAIYPQHGKDSSELLKNADIALYAAKSFGRGGFTAYVTSMGNALRKRASAIQSVREAISQHRFEAVYQPKVDLISRTIMGFEALLKLRGSDGAIIPARSIGHAFDDIDLARHLGNVMLDRVTSDVRRWQAAGVQVTRIALNASAAEFRGGDFAARLLDKLRRAELAPTMFEIEVAETVLAGRGTDYVASALAELAEAGVRVALDDFGTGAASLAQLKRLPFHSIKIDRTFVGTLEDDNGDQAIVRAIVGLADGLGLDLTAVGVETDGQLSALRDIGCKVGQGDLLARTVPAGHIAANRLSTTP